MQVAHHNSIEANVGSKNKDQKPNGDDHQPLDGLGSLNPALYKKSDEESNRKNAHKYIVTVGLITLSSSQIATPSIIIPNIFVTPSIQQRELILARIIILMIMVWTIAGRNKHAFMCLLQEI